jgi:hypothetical protein
MIDENNMWEIIDNVIAENIKENEYIESMLLDNIIIKYARISDHKLFQSQIKLDMWLMRIVSVPTLRTIILEMIQYLRAKEE